MFPHLSTPPPALGWTRGGLGEGKPGRISVQVSCPWEGEGGALAFSLAASGLPLSGLSVAAVLLPAVPRPPLPPGPRPIPAARFSRSKIVFHKSLGKQADEAALSGCEKNTAFLLIPGLCLPFPHLGFVGVKKSPGWLFSCSLENGVPRVV